MLPANIKEYLNKRCISDYILQRNLISWTDNKIVIPVYSSDGVFLFNKYRKSPLLSDNSPKYTYDSGSKSCLFNLNNVNLSATVFITEGELDALCLSSIGLQAISSTGGSGTFKPEWADVLNDCENIYILYDRDNAGYQGALRVQSVIPKAKIIILPEFKGKDITDFVVLYGVSDFLTLITKLKDEAESWSIPEPDFKVGKEKQIKLYNSIANRGLKYREKEFGEVVIKKALDLRESVKTYKPKQLYVPSTNSTLSIKDAKLAPITQYISFNSRGFAKCIWHSEHTPSMKYYPKDNRVHCFGGCAKSGDVIDVVQALHKCTVPEAIKIILNKQ